MASIYNELGCDVEIIEAMDRFLVAWIRDIPKHFHGT